MKSFPNCCCVWSRQQTIGSTGMNKTNIHNENCEIVGSYFFKYYAGENVTINSGRYRAR